MAVTLAGKKALITGANQGLGLEIARHYVRAGADVMLCARTKTTMCQAYEEVLALSAPHQKVLMECADVACADDVNRVAERTLSDLGGCHVLVNNAGIYGPKGPVESLDWSEWMHTIEINLNGSVLTCRALVAHFKTQAYGKIIQLSGGGATAPLPGISAYAVSKAAVILFAETLAEELRGTGIDVNAIAPGALNTRMLDEVLDAGPDKVGQVFYERSLKQKSEGGAPLSRAAELAVFLASPASDGITGKLISALWDNWECWPEHLDELCGSDAYTLRRITGRDRGISWGDK
ncbi:MAG: SDR family oxidoreductase [Rhodocyclaceae bacterium]|nr:SDR family oxidoreductase [Rhodocyclaceae bacterium]